MSKNKFFKSYHLSALAPFRAFLTVALTVGLASCTAPAATPAAPDAPATAFYQQAIRQPSA